MKCVIAPEDKSTPVQRTFELHPSLVARLEAYAKGLNDSGVNYVLGEILNQVLPAEKPARQAKVKPTRDATRKAA